MARRRSFGDISYGIVIGGLALLALVIIVTPVVVVLLMSFGEGQSLKFPPTGFTFRWYAELFDASQSRQIHRAAGNSLEVAALSTLFGAVLGAMGALGLARSRSRMARAADSFFLSPLVLPGIAFGLAALMYFTLVGLRPSLGLIIAGHMIVTVPFIVRTTAASLSQLDPALNDSSQSLGASWFYTLRRVTLPLIAPGIAAGAFLAFMSSIDNVPVSLFLSTARTDMLPIRMWGMMESSLDVRIAAISGVLIAAAFLLMLFMEWTVGLTRRMRE
ncbi:putative spermidine/putrescine transport system permease protein [Enhydrobacter aerosaccus]|uniref:Putative spermidine/putrescine transport system permease protein n=1 Tax=Enhydrobacter aerosaccus TaxID=225324 RepID=A0A1T4K4U1_9HYPH|nr:ABC transporter permease [Enhydrobacter aerosaccus]SJZ37422.1 putative spermidine/putrescine transport system permease protein [Enhydrobacter aerosaccus]